MQSINGRCVEILELTVQGRARGLLREVFSFSRWINWKGGEGNSNPFQYSCWTEELGGLQSMGSQRVGRDWSRLANKLERRWHTSQYYPPPTYPSPARLGTFVKWDSEVCFLLTCRGFLELSGTWVEGKCWLNVNFFTPRGNPFRTGLDFFGRDTV